MSTSSAPQPLSRPDLFEQFRQQLRHIREASSLCRAKDIGAAYHAAIRLRTAVRVVHLLHSDCMDPQGSGYEELYGIVRRAAPWAEEMPDEAEIAIDVRMKSCSNWNHSGIARQCVFDAISDSLRDAGLVSHLIVLVVLWCLHVSGAT